MGKAPVEQRVADDTAHSEAAAGTRYATGDTANLPATTTGREGAVAVADENDFSGFAGAGLQGLSKDDLAIPFLVILQANSPQCKRSDGAYVEGAAEGMLYNSVTKEVYDPVKKPLIVIPCAYDRNFVEWKIRENGGGFVAQHSVEKGIAMQAECMRDDKNRDITKAGNQLNDTRTFFVLIYNEEEGHASPALLSMTSTQIKKAKQWLMQQNLLKLRGPHGSYTPPMYASKWRVTTVPESNDRGSWMGWAFEHVGYLKGPKDPVFIEAQKLADSVAKGTARADYERAGETVGAGGINDDAIPDF